MPCAEPGATRQDHLQHITDVAQDLLAELISLGEAVSRFSDRINSEDEALQSLETSIMELISNIVPRIERVQSSNTRRLVKLESLRDYTDKTFIPNTKPRLDEAKSNAQQCLMLYHSLIEQKERMAEKVEAVKIAKEKHNIQEREYPHEVREVLADWKAVGTLQEFSGAIELFDTSALPRRVNVLREDVEYRLYQVDMLTDEIAPTLSVEAGGIEAEISANILERIFGSGEHMIRDDEPRPAVRKELQYYREYLTDFMAEYVKEASGGKDAAEVSRLPEQERRKLHDGAEQIIVELLQNKKKNKKDRTITNAKQAFQIATATVSVGASVAEAVATGALDITAVIRIMNSIKTIITVIQKSGEDITARAEALEAAMEKFHTNANEELDNWKTKALFVQAIKSARESPLDIDKHLNQAQKAFKSAARNMLALKSTTVEHGSKLSVLSDEWSDARNGVEELLKSSQVLAAEIRNSGHSEAHNQHLLSSVERIQHGLESTLLKTEKIGSLCRQNMQLQIKAKATIAKGKLLERTASDIADVMAHIKKSRTAAQDIHGIVSEGELVKALKGVLLDPFDVACNAMNPSNLPMNVPIADDIFASVISELISIEGLVQGLTSG